MSEVAERLLGLEFRTPQALLVALVPLLVLLVRAVRRPTALRLATFRVLADVPRGARAYVAPAAPWFCCAALVAAGIALARPVERVVLERERLGIDIVVALDVSSSMTEEDLAAGASRLAVARDALRDFVAHRPLDRIGIVAFARFADLVVPLTTDHRALLEALDEVQLVERDGPEDATAIGLGVAEAVRALTRASEQGPRRPLVALLLTDGEENVHHPGAVREVAPADAAELAATLGVRVHALAVGAGGPSWDGRGGPVDTRAMEAIARTSGGLFRRAEDAGALGNVLSELDALERGPLAEPDVRVAPRHVPFVVAAVLSLMLAACVRAFAKEAAP